MTNEELCVLAQSGDENAKCELLKNVEKYIWKIANDQAEAYKDYGIESEELFQEGVVGVLRAIPGFDPERGTKFLTYATYWIVKHINLFIETTDCNKTIKNKGTDEEYPVTFTSFDDDTDDYDGETNAEYIERTLFERKADIYRNTPENVFFKEKKYSIVNEATALLSERQWQYISYRFGIEDNVYHSRKETATHFSLSESRAKTLEKQALKIIRTHFESQWKYINNYVPPDEKEKEWLIIFCSKYDDMLKYKNAKCLFHG